MAFFAGFKKVKLDLGYLLSISRNSNGGLLFMCMADLHRQPANGDHSPAGAGFPVADVPVRRVFRRHPVFPETEMADGLDTVVLSSAD